MIISRFYLSSVLNIDNIYLNLMLKISTVDLATLNTHFKTLSTDLYIINWQPIAQVPSHSIYSTRLLPPINAFIDDNNNRTDDDDGRRDLCSGPTRICSSSIIHTYSIS